ncbi:MAG: hypothetical protein IJL22_04990 [Bacteroidales bacterium]|nr:hypothetical protein [Bacteroidales bacterium]
MDLTDFILEHENDDLAALVLHRDRWPDIDVALAAECIASRRKIRLKVPEWYADPGLVCPVALSAEQCSSTATATYKANLASERTLRLADLTGGLGVDCWQFSKVAGAVLYNEMNPVLFEAAKANLKRLGCDNVEFSNTCISPETLPGLLDSFKPDLVFADPARRSEGRKVFMPEDCSPDVLALQDIVLGRGCCFMIKLSPMADISLMLRKFHCVRELHVVETDGECKELLLMQEPGFAGETKIVVGDLQFTLSEEKAAAPVFISAMPEPGQLLFEPGPALSKSGAFKLISEKYGLRKLGPDTHLYIIDSIVSDLAPYGKWFDIQEVAPFGKASLRDFATRWPGAGVTARALPLSSDELRNKMGLKGGGDVHLFGVGTSQGRLLIAASRWIQGPR